MDSQSFEEVLDNQVSLLIENAIRESTHQKLLTSESSPEGSLNSETHQHCRLHGDLDYQPILTVQHCPENDTDESEENLNSVKSLNSFDTPESKYREVTSDTENTVTRNLSENNQALNHSHLSRTGNLKKVHECDYCGKVFLRACDLSRHRRIHTGDRPYKCEFCQWSFSQTAHLKLHRRTHTGERPFQCDICDKKFIQSNDLTSHKRVHTGEKPYKCEVCKSVFSQSNSLSEHMRIHTGLRPFKCDACGKSFRQANGLNQHIRTHTGERPFQCRECGKSFAASGGLSQHKRVHAQARQLKSNV